MVNIDIKWGFRKKKGNFFKNKCKKGGTVLQIQLKNKKLNQSDTSIPTSLEQYCTDNKHLFSAEIYY